MSLPLSDWDVEVAQYLREIEWGSSRIRRGVEAVLLNCKMLAIRPKWETKAEDEINQAISVLEVALNGMKEAKAIYRNKKMDA